MIRQHKKNDITHIDCDAAPDPYRIAFLWKQLPDSVATHWSTGNEPDGYSSKAFLQCSGFR